MQNNCSNEVDYAEVAQLTDRGNEITSIIKKTDEARFRIRKAGAPLLALLHGAVKGSLYWRRIPSPLNSKEFRSYFLKMSR